MNKNLFEQSKENPVQEEAASKKTKTKSKTPEFSIKNLDKLAMVSTLIKKLEDIKTKVSATVKTQQKDIFIREGIENKKRPVNFRGIDELSTASCQLRKPKYTSELSEEDRKYMDKYDIEYQTVQEKPERYFFNPEVLEIDGILDKINSALNNIDELQGVNVIGYEPPSYRYEVTDDSLNSLFTVDDKKIIENLFDKITTTVVSPKLRDDFNPDTAVSVAKMALVESIEESKESLKE